MRQLKADVSFLESMGTLDYSLLVGVHFPGREPKPDPDASEVSYIL